MSCRVLLLGATDLGAAVARHLSERGIPVVGIVSAQQTFSISYRPSGMFNSRYVDMSILASEIGTQHRIHSDTDDLILFAKEIGANLLIVAGWHKIVPARLRRHFDFPCLGLHASLLPRYRGGAPLNWTILNGDSEGGVSIFELAEGVDEGVIYGQRAFSVCENDDISDLVSKSETAFLELLDEILPGIISGHCVPRPQVGQISYSLQRLPEDGLIDWTNSVESVLRLVRAISRPYPGAFSSLDGKKIIVWRASPCDAEIFGAPGQIAAPQSLEYPAVVLSNGAILILDAEFADGSSAMPALKKAHNRRFQTQKL